MASAQTDHRRLKGRMSTGEMRLSREAERAIRQLAHWGCDPLWLRLWSKSGGTVSGLRSHGKRIAQHDRLARHTKQLAYELSAFFVTFEGVVVVYGSEESRREFQDIPSKLNSLLGRLDTLKTFR